VYDTIVLQLAAYGTAEWLQVADKLYPMVQVDR
jgi:hypothetical protein